MKTVKTLDLTPLPGAYHHGNLRQALVDEGLVLMESSPQGDLSLRELARIVGVSPNAAYRHFANKDALMAALAAEGFRRLRAVQIQAAMKGADVRHGLNLAGRAYIQFAQDNAALFRLMFGGVLSANPTEELAQAGLAAFEILQTAIAQLLDVPATDQQVTVGALTAWSVVHGLSHLVLDGQLRRYEDQADVLIDAVISRFG